MRATRWESLREKPVIISRTPYRVSFFGGGTDYPAWFRQHGGAVLATTIDKYCFLTCRYLPPFFHHRHRIVYSAIELPNTIDEIQHPSVRECLRFLNIQDGVEILHYGDLPARTGMGSSSAFTVGLLNALRLLTGQTVSAAQLARDATYVEQDMAGENVGNQDQAMAATGGLQRIDFLPDDNTRYTPLTLDFSRRDALQRHLMLVYTGVSRNASEIASAQIQATPHRTAELRAMYAMVAQGQAILSGQGDITEFGRLLHESWLLKRSLTAQITTNTIDALYDVARRQGATGGKLLGAGGGGFFLIFAPPERHAAIREHLGNLVHIPFSFSDMGSQAIYSEGIMRHDWPTSADRNGTVTDTLAPAAPVR